MTSTLQKWVLILDIPREIYDLQKRGYRHFRADFEEDTRRVHLRAWMEVKAKGKIHCPGSETEECQHEPFNNRRALEVHQRAKKHGDYVA